MGGKGKRIFGTKIKVKEFHEPVLLEEVLSYLNVSEGKKFIDATVGGGGHTKAILDRGGEVLALDWDWEAIEFCLDRFGLNHKKENDQRYAIGERLILVWASFAHLKETARKFGFEKVDGILFDLGVSSHQLESGERGFSFQMSGPLDMRMDPARQAVRAADLINSLGRRQLEDLFFKFGQEKYSRAIARAVVLARMKKPITETRELDEIIKTTVPRREKIDPSTRIFMALRIAVNSELRNLEEALPKAVDLLKVSGRLAIISFHSLEDRIVKNFMQERGDLEVLTKKPIMAGKVEVLKNPRARSAKLRVVQKIH